MLDGLKSGISTFDFEVHITASGGGSAPVYGSGGRIQSYFTPDYLTVATGILMTASRTGGPYMTGPHREAELLIPALGIDRLWTDPGTDGSVEAVLLLEGGRLITMPSGVWRLHFEALTWTVNGHLEYSHGPFTMTSPMEPVISAIPLLGIPFEISGAAGHSPVHVIGCLGTTDQGSSSFSSYGTITGGYRVKLDGVWHEQPIKLSETSIPGVVSADTCNSVTINAESWEVVEPHKVTQYRKSGGVVIVPNDPSSLIRMEPEYESMIFRWGFPRVRKVDGRYTGSFNCPDGSDSSTNSSTPSDLYPLETQFLSGVTNAAHVIEGPITRDKLSLATAEEGLTVCLPNSWSTTTNATSIDPSFETSTCAASQLNFDPYNRWRAIYTNTIVSPFGNYGLWFPPDDSAGSARWTLLGGPAEIDYYETVVRQQWMYHPLLPPAERTKRRTNVLVDPITQNGVAGNTRVIMGTPCFWGQDLISIDGGTYPSSFTTDDTSAARFTSPTSGITVSVDGTGATLTGTASTVELRFALESFTDYPIMATSWAKQVHLAWSTTNVSNVKVYYVGEDGASKLVTDNVQGAFDVPYAASNKWASSAEVDFGGIYLTDTKSNLLSSDESAVIVSDEDYATSFGMLPGRTGAYLKFEITKTVAANPVMVNHIQFDLPAWNTGKVFYVDGRTSVILFPNGAMLRYGALSFFDYLSDTPLSVPQAVSATDGAPAIGDCWAWLNCFRLGKTALDGLLTRMGNEYLEDEEFPAGVIKHLWRFVDDDGGTHQDSMSWVVNTASGPTFGYDNTWRCMPNVWFLPAKKRTAVSNWVANGSYGQYRYSHSTSKHAHIVPGPASPKLMKDGVDTLTMAAAPLGWSVSTFQKPVENDEGYDYTLRWDNKDWFKMRPWRGTANVLGLSDPASGPVWNITSRDHRFLLSWADSGGAKCRWWSYLLPKGDNDTVTIVSGSDYEQCRVYDDNRNRIYAMIGRNVSGTLTCGRAWSDDGGKTWSSLEAMGITNGRYPHGCSNRRGDRLEAAFVYDSGTSGPGVIKVLHRSSGDASFSGPVTCKDSSGADLKFVDQSFGLHFGHDSAERVILSATIDGESSPSSWWSTDVMSGGMTFMRFS